MKRGRRTLLTPKLQKQICRYLSDCCTIRTTLEATGISQSSFFLWIEKGERGISPYQDFSEAVTRARGRAKARIVRSLLDEKDWRARLEILARVFPDEYGRRDPLPIPQEKQTTVTIPMFATLPSGNIASVDEMMEVARQWHKAQPREQHEPLEKPTENESEMWYNPATRRLEPRDLPLDGNSA